jgi:hypothetical protein
MMRNRPFLVRRGREKERVPSRRVKIDGGTSQPGKKKDLSRIKYFPCQKNGHYASQC